MDSCTIQTPNEELERVGATSSFYMSFVREFQGTTSKSRKMQAAPVTK